MSSPDSTASNPQRGRIAFWLAGLVAIGMIVAALVPRMQRQARAADTAKEASSSLPDVSVVKAKLASGSSELELPGNLEPISVASIYARTNGYVRERLADIGTPVKSGQVLAIIDTPEIDQELAQARASLEQARAALEQANANLTQAEAQVTQSKANINQARANESIAATTNERWTRLLSNGVVPRQQADERRSAFNARQAETQAAIANSATAEANVVARTADIAAAKAAVQAQVANVRRYEKMQGFQRILAPFDGVVTERRIEKGDLVSAGSGGDRNLFSVAQGNVLRIQASVPQTYAVDLHRGQQAQVQVRERPGEVFRGTVARTAESITSTTRTLLTEVQVDNSAGRLLPGMYGQVKFSLPRDRAVVLIPGSALVVNAQGTRVLKLQEDRRVRMVKVQVGRDLGAEVEVLGGLSGHEELVNNPPDTLADGQQVNVPGGNKQ